MNKTKIDYCDFTWSPTHGCSHVSIGCDNCWARAMSKRLASMKAPGYSREDPFRVVCMPDKLNEPLKHKKPTVIAVSFMGDIAHEMVPDEMLDRIWGTMAACPQHRFIVLTKRPQRLYRYLRDHWVSGRVALQADIITIAYKISKLGKEIRRPVDGFPGYLVSNYGNVYSEGGKLRPGPDKDGHLQVMLRRDCRSHPKYVHRLVLEAFDRPAMAREQTRHLDDNPANNALPNLSWGSAEDNWDDRRRHGVLGGLQKLTSGELHEIKRRYSEGEAQISIAVAFGISRAHVRNIGEGRTPAPSGIQWPLPNVIGMVTVEDQKTADERVPWLLKTPFAMRGVSVEPMLSSVMLNLGDRTIGPDKQFSDRYGYNGRIHWAVCGGESGHGARPMHPQWARNLRDQCIAAGVPYFFKQWSSWMPVATPRQDYKGKRILMSEDGSWKYCSWEEAISSSGDQWAFEKMNKKIAGHLLDGVEWHQMPEGIKV